MTTDEFTPGVTYRVTGVVWRTETATYRGHGWWETADGTRYFVNPSVIVRAEVLVESIETLTRPSTGWTSSLRDRPPPKKG